MSSTKIMKAGPFTVEASEEFRRQVEELAEGLGITYSDVFRRAIRQMDRTKGIDPAYYRFAGTTAVTALRLLERRYAEDGRPPEGHEWDLATVALRQWDDHCADDQDAS